MVAKLHALQSLIGSGDSAGLSETDESTFDDDDSVDVDFEESTTEVLRAIENEAIELATMAGRFSHNIFIRNQPTAADDTQPLQAPATTPAPTPTQG